MNASPPSDSSSEAGWYVDPLGRHDFRYYDGQTWTPHVADDGLISHDSPPSATQSIPFPALGTSGPHEASNHRPPKGLSLPEAVKRCLRLYATFRGRAARSEFWWFTVLVYLAVFAGRLVGGIADPEVGGAVGALVWLALLLPALAVTVRRLHDINKRGWWMLIWFVPLIGSLVVLLFMILDGTPEANRFGPPPT